MTDDVAGADGVTGEASETTDDDAYSGLFGAFPYAFRSSDSLAFKSYALLGGLLALAITALFGMALVVLIASSTGSGGGTFSFSRAFFILVGLCVVAPLLAPVLYVARRHRREGPDSVYDARLASLGYLFLGSLYVALLVSTPEDQQVAVDGVFAPVVELFYSLPPIVGLVPPLAVALLIWYAGRSG